MTKFRRMLKDAKGFTLVELLAVIVILGIIAAIAVPSVTGLIERSEKDATISNAEQMIEAARLKSTQDGVPEGGSITLKELIDQGYLEDGEISENSGKVFYTSSNGSDSVGYAVYFQGDNYTIGSDDSGVARSDLNRENFDGDTLTAPSTNEESGE
ncbi:competence type IV pilus major pilin ComGC [Salimicrobium flavidum]|uniref:Type IV pilus assembly protein PilA n=1 Tax=Salimicrobium flavidum TaxID=570947 RepID=A0A1N7JMV8_9BACI|nr:prepilin-type N-terminal cleavage/methylation domain-containing protein [Salimicrobium flavidum]SIS50645.1 type IV pilus assembly protein PilA [Salimicrobium flavidum]